MVKFEREIFQTGVLSFRAGHNGADVRQDAGLVKTPGPVRKDGHKNEKF